MNLTSPYWIRIAPFALFYGLTSLQGVGGETSRYWVYFAKSVVGVWLVWKMIPLVAELRLTFSWQALGVGVLVFGVWVGLEGYYPPTDQIQGWVVSRVRGLAGGAEGVSGQPPVALPWNPHAQFGEGSGLALFFVIVRILGSSLVVPALEEVFYRSFLYRYVAKPDYLSVPLVLMHPLALAVSSLVFGFCHREWLPGIFCAFAYQALVIRRGHLGDAVCAHGVTNLLLGLYVSFGGHWKFW